jgi:phage shock protein PspC (stress-responsive transcriptional regulator)
LPAASVFGLGCPVKAGQLAAPLVSGGVVSVCGIVKMRNDGTMSNINGGKVLVRKVNNRIVAGVCAGLAEYLDVDVNLVRLVVALITVITVGVGVVGYLVAWAVIPEEGQKGSIAEDLINKNKFN